MDDLGFNPPSGFVLFRRAVYVLSLVASVGFNPPSGFVLFRSHAPLPTVSACCGFNPPSGFVLFRSAGTTTQRVRAGSFQSAKRICAVSKLIGVGSATSDRVVLSRPT